MNLKRAAFRGVAVWAKERRERLIEEMVKTLPHEKYLFTCGYILALEDMLVALDDEMKQLQGE